MKNQSSQKTNSIELDLSMLPKTWIIDVDGVVFIHNSHLDKGDVIIKNFKEFFQQIPKEDMVILVTSRSEKYKEKTEKSLKKNKIRFNHIIYNAPFGERILINDIKPKGLRTAMAVNTKRDKFKKINLIYHKEL